MNARLRALTLAVQSAPSVLLQSLALVALVLLNQVLNVGATIGFALSGLAGGFGSFVFWQVVGSVFGLGAQITFAGMVRLGSVRLANSIGIGLAFVSAQVFSAYWFFKEPFSAVQWLGTALIFIGILLIALGR